MAAAQRASHVVLALGLSSAQETEARDRVLIDLPAAQHAVATAVLALAGAHRPTAVRARRFHLGIGSR